MLSSHCCDPDGLFALMAAVAARGWAFRLAAGANYPRSWAEIVVPGLDVSSWANMAADSPELALGGALALALDTPPPRVG